MAPGMTDLMISPEAIDMELLVCEIADRAAKEILQIARQEIDKALEHAQPQHCMRVGRRPASPGRSRQTLAPRQAEVEVPADTLANLLAYVRVHPGLRLAEIQAAAKRTTPEQIRVGLKQLVKEGKVRTRKNKLYVTS